MMRLLGILFLALASGQAHASTLQANVDRQQFGLGETVQLVLESPSLAVSGTPDLGPLRALFRVLDVRQVNRLSSQDGASHSSTRWIVSLAPRQAGYVIIPPLRLGDAWSSPITLQVAQARPPDAAPDTLAPVFIETSLDQDSVYVQAQAVLTLRIYHSVSLFDDSSLTPLQTVEAHVEQLGKPVTYEKRLNGVRHGVIEVRYAIFPLRSGEIELPAQTFSATLVERNNVEQFNPFGPRPGRSVRVTSPAIALKVRAKPADYPVDAPWLPASALTLSETWSPDAQRISVGDSLTRQVLLRAEGLSSTQLPPLPATQAADLRQYPDQPRLSNESSPQGLIGSREQSEALVPGRAGQLQIPALEIVWWNTRSDTLERSRLPARSFAVASNPQLESPPLQVIRGQSGQSLWLWQLSSALLACSTVLGFALWWHARRQPAIQRTALGPNTRTLLDDLKRACLANDPQATRHALDAWVRPQTETLADLAARFVPLSDALDGLNGVLYGESGQTWNGEALWKAIRDLPARQAENDQGTPGALPPLYPR